MGAFQNTSSDGVPVDVANATPVLAVQQLLAAVAYTSVSPNGESTVFYIESADDYGVSAQNSVSAKYIFTITKPVTIGVKVNGIIQYGQSFEAGRHTIDFQDAGNEIPVAFGDEVVVTATYIADDGSMSEGKLILRQGA